MRFATPVVGGKEGGGFVVGAVDGEGVLVESGEGVGGELTAAFLVNAEALPCSCGLAVLVGMFLGEGRKILTLNFSPMTS